MLGNFISLLVFFSLVLRLDELGELLIKIVVFFVVLVILQLFNYLLLLFFVAFPSAFIKSFLILAQLWESVIVGRIGVDIANLIVRHVLLVELKEVEVIVGVVLVHELLFVDFVKHMADHVYIEFWLRIQFKKLLFLRIEDYKEHLNATEFRQLYGLLE